MGTRFRRRTPFESEGETGMTDLISLLNENDQISAWRVVRHSITSYELFFVHENVETVRATDTLDTDVTVYVEHDQMLGDSTFSLSQAMSKEEIREKINTATRRAKLVFNKPFELPSQAKEKCRLPSNLSEDLPKETARKIADAVFAAKKDAGCSINALEIFLVRDTVSVQNSRGLDKEEVRHRAMVEAIPTFTDENQSVELYENLRFTTFDEKAISERIAEKMREVKDRALAEKPSITKRMRVMLRAKEIEELLTEIVNDLNFATVYAGANLYSIGDDLQRGAVDKITLTLEGEREGCDESASFDDDGLGLTSAVLIKDGLVQQYHGANRFGQYLGVSSPTGVMRCMKLDKGTLTDNEKDRLPYLECASLSGLQVDLYNDYIGGEIRLGYLYDGKEKKPVTGITMSGTLSKVLSTLRLSDQIVQEGSYEGPALMLLEDMKIL